MLFPSWGNNSKLDTLNVFALYEDMYTKKKLFNRERRKISDGNQGTRKDAK